ncbi:MAG: phosphoglucosamine mutase [Bacteroidales bacterium]|nr:phosphoglucosamine mutase [Bacteroidales bacterium]
MTLISSISGIRGTIGGKPGDNLTPQDIVNYTSAYATVIKEKKSSPKVVVGRDGRSTGLTVKNIIISTLQLMGVDVIDIDYTTTPTIEMAIIRFKSDGGIMISASHNPMQWNALKLFDPNGEFVNAEDGKRIKALAENRDFTYVEYTHLGKVESVNDMIDYHINKILELPYVDRNAIAAANFRIGADTVNSTGAISVPRLIEKLGVKKENIFIENGDICGEFAHNPEPLAKNLTGLSSTIISHHCNLGIAVDPDVDRLAFMSENGVYFGEEYTLVACADYILSMKKGNTVSNLSSSRALKDVTNQHGGNYYASPVGEVNVVHKMKEANAVIGGEGNGGVILPDLHYGRDALLGIALLLTYLAKSGLKMTELREKYPKYYMAKDKITLDGSINFENVKQKVKDTVQGLYNEEDGLKIDFDNSWVHLRTSNTEPIIRVYSEAKSQDEAEELAHSIVRLIEG